MTAENKLIIFSNASTFDEENTLIYVMEIIMELWNCGNVIQYAMMVLNGKKTLDLLVVGVQWH